MAKSAHTNPFRYGDLALDEAFTDRKAEIEELKSDMRNGQNVVVFAPRRYGKSSLLWRATQELTAGNRVLVAQIDLMATPSKEKLAEKLAEAIYEDIATPLFRVRGKAIEIFANLRVRPVVTIDPTDGSLSFAFEGSARSQDIDDTLARLFELPAKLAADRKKKVALVIDEFQEVIDLDPKLPTLMRSIFQTQPEVAHVYLGSKRSMMKKIFNDPHEPFWRSAKQIELGLIDPEQFASFIRRGFDATDRGLDEGVVEGVLEITNGHPYGTQELCYFLWAEVPEGFTARRDDLDAAVTKVLRSEHAHFSTIWVRLVPNHRLILQALAEERHVRRITDAFRHQYGLPHDATVRKALRGMIEDELVLQDDQGFRIAEPFFAEWIRRYQS